MIIGASDEGPEHGRGDRPFSQPMRVLILEDSPEDLALCLRELRKAGFDLHADSVTTRELFTAKLESQTYDVILSDYGIPGWSGLAAFRFLKASGRNIPFILVTGTLGEEAAVEMIREGVDDYVLKDRLIRLPEAIRRALAERTAREERRQAMQALRDSEERVRLLLDSTAEAIFGIDPNGSCTFCNSACLRLLGYDAPTQLLGKDMHALIHHSRSDGTPLPAEECGFLRAFREGQGLHIDNEVLWRKNGSNFPVAYRSRPMFQDGRPVGAVVTFMDITEQKRNGEVRRQLAAIVECSDDAIVGQTTRGIIVSWNRGAQCIFGYPAEEVIGRPVNILVPSDRPDEISGILERVKAGKEVRQYETVRVRKDGQRIHVALTVSHIKDAAGRVTGIASIARDITKRKRTEEDVRRLAAIVESSSDAILSASLNGTILTWNAGAEVMFGYTAPEAIGQPVAMLVSPDHDFEFDEIIETLRHNQQYKGRRSIGLRKDGGSIHLALTISLMNDTGGHPLGVSITGRDITAPIEAEKALQRSEAQYRVVTETATDAFVTISSEGAIRFVNAAAEIIFGYSRAEMLGQNLTMLIPEYSHCLDEPEFDQPLYTDKKHMNWERAEVTGLHKNGTEIPLEVSFGECLTNGERSFTGVVRDIGERKQMEQQLLHARKLEAVGGLAAGIAHEINTPIQFVGDNARFLQESFGGIADMVRIYEVVCTWAGQVDGDKTLLEQAKQAREKADWEYLQKEIPKALEQMLEGVGRVAKIVRAMKEFSHVDQSAQKSAADLNKAMESTLVVAGNELKYVADVEADYGELPPVMCHVGDLNQVFLNLLVNAAHAIGDVVKGTGQKGHIGVRTRREGEWVEIAISDTGAGIPEKIRDKIFNPFFTTKEVGKGSGQGLALARAMIVEKHGGTLTFETEMGSGTTFRVRLPLSGAPVAKGLVLA